jgi:hypothetical protein
MKQPPHRPSPPRAATRFLLLVKFIVVAVLFLRRLAAISLIHWSYRGHLTVLFPHRLQAAAFEPLKLPELSRRATSAFVAGVQATIPITGGLGCQ